MKYAIISDIHANAEALEAVLIDQHQQGCTHIACLGDIVGYGPDPKKCVDYIRALDIPCLKGNHDEYVATDMPLSNFNENAAKVIWWTRLQLTADDREWLGSLKYVRILNGFTIVHATLDDPQRWGYVFDKLAAAANFIHQTTDVCFFGHTHVPVAFIKDSVVRGGTFSKFKIESKKKYFINVGSVGQSRDGNVKATYVTYDLDTKTVQLSRVDYDYRETQRKIRDLGLPSRLA